MKKSIDLSKATTIKENWDGFSLAHFGDGRFSETQINETKKAFYAGFMGCLGTMNNIAKNFDEKVGAEVYENMRLEGQAFFRQQWEEFKASQ